MATQNMTWVETLHDITIGGIDFETMEGYGGLKCKQYSSIERRILESVLYLVVSVVSILLSAKLSLRDVTLEKKLCNITNNNNNNCLQNGTYRRDNTKEDYNESFRTTILFIYTLVNGIELGYKVISFYMLQKFKKTLLISLCLFQHKHCKLL